MMSVAKNKSEWNYAVEAYKSFNGASQNYFTQEKLYQPELRRHFQTYREQDH